MPRPKFHTAEARKKNAWDTPHYESPAVISASPFRPTPMKARLLLAVALSLSLAALSLDAAMAASCSAVSGQHTAALVELYTSEGCDSCPPADRWLSSLGGAGQVTRSIVPIALHVDYWDYI